MILAGLVVFLIVAYLFGPFVSFTFALVIGTLLLAWVTAFLASANQSLADAAARNEIRGALDAARKFVEIEPRAFLDVLKGESRSHPFLEAIDSLASHGNKLHDKDTVRDLLQFASDMDDKKIGNAALADAKDKLIELQGRIVKEIALMRGDLRDLTQVYLYP